MEELDVRNRPAVDRGKDLVGLGALDLEPIMGAIDRLAIGPRVGAGIVVQANLPSADRGLELDPVGSRGAADENEFVLKLAEDDHVTNHMASRSDRHKVLGAVKVEVRKAVDANVRKERRCIGAFDDQLVHVVSLVEQHGAIAPGTLLIAPVCVFRGNNRIDIHPDLRVSQHLYRVFVFGHDVRKARHIKVSLSGLVGRDERQTGDFVRQTGLAAHEIFEVFPRKPRVFAGQRLGAGPLTVADCGKEFAVLALGAHQRLLKIWDDFLPLQEGRGRGKRQTSHTIDLPLDDRALGKPREDLVKGSIVPDVGRKIETAGSRQRHINRLKLDLGLRHKAGVCATLCGQTRSGSFDHAANLDRVDDVPDAEAGNLAAASSDPLQEPFFNQPLHRLPQGRARNVEPFGKGGFR